MAWTQADVDALKAAMAKGARTVAYADGSVTYHSLADMKDLLRTMQAEVSPDSAPVRRTVAKFDRGF